MAVIVKEIHDNNEFFNVQFSVDNVNTEFTAGKQAKKWEPAGDFHWYEIEETETGERMGHQFPPYITDMLNRAVGFTPDIVE